MKKAILVVDDDEKLVDLVHKYLTKDGYQVIKAYQGIEALRKFRKREVDLVVLDLMLPKMDGLKVCKKIRSKSDTPVIMLTAKTKEEDKIKGLDLGADDYITKPFSPGELLARVRAVLRRVEEDEGPEELTYGSLTVNFNRHKVFFEGETVEVTATEFKLLGALIKNPGRAFTRPQLIHEAFGYGYEGLERTIDVHVKNLRKKIEPDPGSPQFLVTVYGVGYKFEPPQDFSSNT